METRPKLIGIVPQLVVPDVVATANWYINVVGFTLIGYFLDPPVYAMLQRDGYQVHFGKADDGAVHHNGSIRKGTPDFGIWVPEIDQFYMEVKNKGGDIVQDIIQRSYGREFLIADNDGHIIMVCD